MSRLYIDAPDRAQSTADRLSGIMEQRLAASPPGLCPVDLARNFLNLCHSQTCGKCSPCRIGLGQLSRLLDDVLEGDPGDRGLEILRLIEDTAKTVADTADCALGVEAARMILAGLKGFRNDYQEHLLNGRCVASSQAPVPCVAQCPAHVDIPGYLSLIRAGRCADAVRLIRKDNPFPVVCAYICEHPCENRCRRATVDASINIRALKRFAVDNAGEVSQPACAEKTGKSVGVVGGGPGGLTAAYYLALMGHAVTVYEKRDKLGGMLRYGIPDYRLPRTLLDAEIHSILSLGIETRFNVAVGTKVAIAELRQKHDALFLSIGAHTDKKMGIEGESSANVISAVEMLRGIGDGTYLDFSGKRVVVVGGGNVAMDVVRTSIRLGAEKVACVYRRRKVDMTALPEEVEGAIAEGADIIELHAPVRVESDEKGVATALWVRRQIVGAIDAGGRPRPSDADSPEIRIPADIIVVAIGQGVEKDGLDEGGVRFNRWGTLDADVDAKAPELDGVFAGGDCVTGPATVIRAIAAGRVAAANIDEYLGFHHEISVKVDVPGPRFSDLQACGRVNTVERSADERKKDFNCMELGMTCQEAEQESGRCLRCDHFGFGSLKGGREEKW